MGFNMIVESDDWNELTSSVIDKQKQIENLRKVLENLCEDFKINRKNYLDSEAYKEAIKLV